jgi:DNA polymerase-3 subunit gamma/tau
MSYQVIARKWRPQTFDEVTGQEPITRTLRNAIEHERLHHAYLFSGARGVGKTTTARLLAKALNCHKFDHPTSTPCVVGDPTACASCKEIAEGRSIDVLEIDAASNTGIDNVRDAIISNVAISPARDRYKVFIIDEVHMLSGAAFNALLKTLEEPPPRVVFIMATTESHKLPDTILSRCQQFEFRTIAPLKIAERLRLIADAEKINIAEDALREIARAGEGSMRDAQSAFDQVISFSGNEIVAADVETALGIAGTEMLARVVGAIAEHKASEALAVVDDLVMRGHDLRNFCRDLLAHLRNLLVAKVSGEAAEMLESSASDGRELARQANAFSESDLIRFFHSLTETENNLRIAAHPRYQLEIGLVKLMEMRRLAPMNQIIERLTTLEESLRTGVAPALNRTPTPAAGSGSAPSTTGGMRSKTSGGTTSRASNTAQGATETKSATPADAENNTRSAPNVATPNVTPQNAAATTASPLNSPASSDDAPFGGVGGPTRPTTSANSTVLSLVPPALTGIHAATTTTAASEPSDPFGDSLSESDDDYAASAGATPSTSDGAVVERIKAALEKRHRMFLVIALEGARRVVVEGNDLLVEFPPSNKHLRDNLTKPDAVKILREVCLEVVGREINVQISVKEAADGNSGGGGATSLSKQEEERRAKAELRKVAEQHPMVQEFLHVFRGEIIDVRRTEEP